MKHIAIYCVNYNSYNALDAYLKSIDNSAAIVKDSATVDVYIADNTESNVSEITFKPAYANIRVFAYHKNNGYLGAVCRMMRETAPDTYDFCIISNVDLQLCRDTLSLLISAGLPENTGWIAPQIYSECEKRDRNPKIENRYPAKKLRILRFMYRYPLLYRLYTATLYKSKKLRPHHAPGPIYAGHGSFMILTREFCKRCRGLDYPVFLFCEEIFIAEQCRNHNLTVRYYPSIKVTDMEHASTGKMPNSQYCRFNFEATDYILRTFY